MAAKPRQVRREKPAIADSVIPPVKGIACKPAVAAQTRPAEEPPVLKAEVRADAPTPTPPQELIAPQEYDALLRGLDHEHTAPPPQAHDDLWERLARTGWLPKPPKAPETPRRTTRVAQRPSA